VRRHGVITILTKAAPNVTVGMVDLENGAQILDCCRESVLCAQDTCDALHSWHRPLVELERLFVALHGAFEVVHLL
jgi:hypothetical protein